MVSVLEGQYLEAGAKDMPGQLEYHLCHRKHPSYLFKNFGAYVFRTLTRSIDVFKIAMFSRGFQGFCKGFSGIRCQS